MKGVLCIITVLVFGVRESLAKHTATASRKKHVPVEFIEDNVPNIGNARGISSMVTPADVEIADQKINPSYKDGYNTNQIHNYGNVFGNIYPSTSSGKNQEFLQGGNGQTDQAPIPIYVEPSVLNDIQGNNQTVHDSNAEFDSTPAPTQKLRGKKLNNDISNRLELKGENEKIISDSVPASTETVNDLPITKDVSKIQGNVSPTNFKGDCNGMGLTFGGGHLTTSSSSFKPLSNGDMTFIAWIRVSNTDKMTTIYSTVATNGGKQVLEVRPSEKIAINGHLKWTVTTDKSKTLFSIKTNDVIPAGIWTHLVAKYDGKQGRSYLFVNGEKVTKEKGVSKAAKFPWGSEIVIGGLVDETGKVASVYTGGMLGIRFVEKPLTDAEIKSEYDSCKLDEGEEPYLVTVCSGEKLTHGTTSKVHIKLYGEDGQLGETKLGKNFKAGCSKTKTIYGPPVGKIKKLSVRKDTSGILGKTWKLAKITIEAGSGEDASDVYTFICNNCKFSEKKGETLQRFLEANPEVNGGWSVWSDWSGCATGMCGGDRKVRTKACINPEPSDGGKQCTLQNGTVAGIESEVQPCQIDGGWGAWSSWSECAKLCGGSTVKRTRTCDNPAAANGGKPCTGADSETKQDCTDPCEDWPINGGWTEWNPWSTCAASCGGSTVTRKRTCTEPAPLRGGLPCEGDDTETATDCTSPCPIDGGWTDWEPWSDCSTTCGPGQQTHERNCTNPSAAFGGKPCDGEANEVQECKVIPCPNAVNGNWGEWGSWSVCSETEFCDLGKKTRTRKCDSPAPSNGGDLCPGLDTEDETCPKENCKPAEGDSIEVKPTSFIAESCKTKTAYFAGGTKANEIPGTIYDKYLSGISSDIKTSYFSKTTEKQNGIEVTKFCFQPGTPLLVQSIDKVIAGFSQAPSLPDFTKPAPTENTAGLSVSLKPDASLYSVEFSLGDSKEYSPFKDTKMRDAKFFFREKLGKPTIVAYGKHTLVENVKFDAEVIPGPILSGQASEDATTDLETIVTKLSLPQTTALVGTQAATIQEKLLNSFINYLSDLALSKVPVTGLTEAASGTTKRISGSVAAADQQDLFHFEIVKQKSFAIGLTSDKTSFQNFMEKILSKLKKKPESIELFGDMTDATIGIAFAQAGFKTDKTTSFQREPLKTGFAGYIKEGVFIAARARLPQTCKSNACKIAQVILGKESVLMLSGSASLKELEIKASVLDRVINEKVKLSKVELFVKVTFKPIPKAKVGFNIVIVVPIKGDVYKDNVKQPNSDLTLSGTFELSSSLDIAANLAMNGIWRNAFGFSFLSFGNLYLSFQISAVTGIPNKLAVGGEVHLGKDCFEEKDFGKDGMCIKGVVDLSLTPNPETQFVYGELSAVTLGKVLRMVGSKLELPKRIAGMGFPKTVVFSLAWAEQKITYLAKPRTIKKGLYISGDLDLFGFTTGIEIQVNSELIFFKASLSPIELPGNVMIVRSFTDKKNGPLFHLKVTRSPLNAEIFLQGAVKILNVETEIKFVFKPSMIEANLKLKLPVGGLGAELSIKGGYGESLKESSLTVNVSITTDKAKIEQDVSKDVETSVNKAREALQDVKDKLKDQKEKCKKQTTSYCQLCQDLICEKITAGCEAALDRLKNFIGGAANKFGGWFVGVSKKISKEFKEVKTRRSVEFFPGRAQMATRIRRKRFVGRFLCKTLAPAICRGSVIFCEASCSLSKHITKGVCKGLDLAHKGLFLVENSFHWVKQAYDLIPKQVLILHGISFEVAFSPSLQNRVAADIDLTVMKVRRKLTVEISLASIVEMGKAIVNKAIEDLKKMISVRHKAPSYDKPNNAGDIILSAPFRIQNKGSGMCIKSLGTDKGSALGAAACAGTETEWVFTLTGALMNINNGLCITVTGEGNNMKVVQQACLLQDPSQRFTCNMNRIYADQSKTKCFLEKASTVAVEACKAAPADETEEFVTPENEEWVVHKDPRHKVCDNFVEDLALNKPAQQSSTFSSKDIDETEMADLNPKDKETLFNKAGPELAVNGDLSSSLSDGSCSHTSLSQDPWWKVDLSEEHVITDVSIQTAFEGVKVSALERFEIRVGIHQEFQKNPMCGIRVKVAHLGELWTSTCSQALPGRYVSVQSFGQTYLTLCEVAVYARKDNQGKCSDELRRRRSQIMSISHKDRVLKRAQITYGRYD